MRGMGIRLIIAIIVIAVVRLLIGPVFHLLGLPLNGDAETVILLVSGLIALWYIVWGSTPSWPAPSA
jgi:hypothetical protein